MAQRLGKDAQVIICGAGPIGMALALDLADKGVPTILLESTDGKIETPKLGLVSIRTMEIFRRLNLAGFVRDTGFRPDCALSMVYCTSVAGHFLGRIPYPSLEDEPFIPESPETKWRCSQIFLNPLLQSRVEANPLIDLRLSTKMESFEDRGTHVEVSVSCADKSRETLSALYFIGCDGAGSRVRRDLGIDAQGENELDYSVAIFFRSKALARDHAMGDAERYFVLDEHGWWGSISAMDGYELWRLTVPGTKETAPGIVANAHELVRRALGSEKMKFEILSSLPWRRSQLIADRFSSGRIFMAGDSVHTMSPTGGLGMNTGMGDVDNLGWKLAAVLAGWGGAALLETYGAERRPIAIRNSEASTHNYFQLKSVKNCAGIFDDGAEGDKVRARVGEEITSATETEWEMLGVHLGYRYDDSSIVVADGTPADEDHWRWYKPTARPGHRAPHAWISGGPRDGISTLDLFGREFVLLRFGNHAPSDDRLAKAARAVSVPYRSHNITDPAIETVYEKPLVLVRPDGHVAWRGNALPADCDGLIATVTGRGV